MSFDEDCVFPECISFGSLGGPRFLTDVAVSASGYEQRISKWSQTRASYNVVYGVKSYEDLEDLIEFFYAVNGKLIGFRYKDPLDNTSAGWTDREPTPTTSIDQLIGTGDGSTYIFQLVKNYVCGSQTFIRDIKKPVAGSAKVSLDGSLQSELTDYALNHTTGEIVFRDPPGVGVVIRAGYEFHVPCRFDTDSLPTSFDTYRIGSIESIPIVELKIDTGSLVILSPNGLTHTNSVEPTVVDDSLFAPNSISHTHTIDNTTLS